MIERFSSNEKEKQELEELARQSDDYQPFIHPRYWAAFICQGDPSPMPSPEALLRAV